MKETTINLWEEKNLTELTKNLENNGISVPNGIIKKIKKEFVKNECKDIGKKKKWKKICPNCKNEVFYISKQNLDRSIKENRGCLKCNSLKKDRYVGMKFGTLTIINQYDGVSPCGSKIVKVDYKCDCGYIGLNRRFGCVKRQKMCLSCKRRNKFKILLNGETAFNTLFSNYKKSAKNRNYQFNLTKEEFRNLTKRNCFYCGKEPSYKIKQKSTGIDYVYNGIDRKDNDLGYSLENSITCCGICNVLKRTLSVNEFLAHIKKIYEYKFVENKK